MGGRVFECNYCSRLRYSYHSCCNRSCPKYHKSSNQAWLQAREKELMPVPYYHVIFTLPHELSGFVRLYQQDLYSLLIKSAADSIIKLAADPHYVGGQVGVMAVLHTWGSNLSYCTLPGYWWRSITGWTDVDICQGRLSCTSQCLIEVVSRYLPRPYSKAIQRDSRAEIYMSKRLGRPL